MNTPSSITERRYLDVDEVANLLRTTRAAIYKMIKRGQIPGVTHVGRRLLVRHDKLVEWLDNNSSPEGCGR